MIHSISKMRKELLREQCEAVGIRRGDTIMVHASLRSVGEILGGPDVLISALVEAVGNEGTVMAYVGCQMPFDDVGRGIFSVDDEQYILAHCPAFEPDKARASRDFGAFAELFRTTPGVICSRNPGCRMAAFGAKAKYLTEDHPFNYGLGLDSPLHKFHDLDGKVVLLGSDLDCVTLLHYAEAIAPIPNKKTVRLKLPLLRDSQPYWLDIEEYNSSTGIRDWPDNYFAQIVQAFIDNSSDVQIGEIGKAKSYVLNAKELVAFASDMMVEEAKLI